MANAQRLVDLFLQAALPSAAKDGTGADLDAEAIERGMESVENVCGSEDALRHGVTSRQTFVLLGISLEEKPGFGAAAARCYVKALESASLPCQSDDLSDWERATLLQQLGSTYIKEKRFDEAERSLALCAECCESARGHPREAKLFGGACCSDQTRIEFMIVVEKLRAQTCFLQGDEARARRHVAEARRLEASATGDAVERLSAVPGSTLVAQAGAESIEDEAARLWPLQPAKERHLSEYHFVDEGPTVKVILDLNEHLGIGAEASRAVTSLRQFRVNCEKDAVRIQLRLRKEDSSLWHFHLLLRPLVWEIVPEDTVPKLRGRDVRKRLEIRIFKKDKKTEWRGDIVRSRASNPEKATRLKSKGPSLLNPLSPEELAQLPRPGEIGVNNRPAAWRSVDEPGAAPLPAVPTEPPLTNADGGATAAVATLPPWVTSVEEHVGENSSVRISVHLGSKAGARVSLDDLDLDASSANCLIRLKLAICDTADGRGRQDVLELRPRSDLDVDAVAARWRRKAKTLELNLPARAA